MKFKNTKFSMEFDEQCAATTVCNDDHLISVLLQLRTGFTIGICLHGEIQIQNSVEDGVADGLNTDSFQLTTS